MEKIRMVVDTTNKEFMFKLGFLFAQGKQIEIVNKEDVENNISNEEKLGYSKSFNMMIKYWQDHGLDKNISEIKSDKSRVFFICPVRNATLAEKEKLAESIKKYENDGYCVHYPERDTNQNPVVNGVNTGGFNICLQNAIAIANSRTVAIYYNKTSTGSMFDLGVACCLQELYPERKFIIENSFTFESNNYIDNKIKMLSSKSGSNNFNTMINEGKE